MFGSMKTHLEKELASIRSAGLYKEEQLLTSAQSAHIRVQSGKEVINFCANNYLGLADDERVIDAARKSLTDWGYGLSSVRFICGTQEIHSLLERRIAAFLGTDAAILYSSCFDANGGLFETLLSSDDAVISDALNHASIIDGIRLSKAERFVYETGNMAALEERLREAKSRRFRLIATDGVFSMDGSIAKLEEICDLADRYDATVMVDDSHAVGVLGARGKGSHEYRNVLGRVDVITGTLGKALGGASGGYTAARKEIVEILRQRSRPYLFSNSVAPTIVSASIAALDILENDPSLLKKLRENTGRFRTGMKAAGFRIPDGEHPIVPIMLGEATVALEMATRLLSEGIYVIGFSYPVVPKGTARIRVQVSAAHSVQDIDLAVAKFRKVRDEMNLD